MAVRRAKRIVPRAEKKSLNNVDNKILIIAQEIKLAKVLSGNDKKSRDKILKHLKKWLTYRSASSHDFVEKDFMRIWKGLFYCVWMSDKPLVQEELCENISKLFECFAPEKFDTSILFYKCFLSTMAADWFGIDQHRLDKFLMFVRRMTRGVLRCLKEQKWSAKSLEVLNKCLTDDNGILSSEHPKLCLGLQMHLVDCWMEEISKVSEGDISAKAVVALCKPFAQFLSYGEETRLSSSITRNIFIHLCRQTDVGVEYQERLNAWKKAGFPGGSVDAMERVEVDEDEDSDDAEDNQTLANIQNRKIELDPRAGNVDTELAQLPVDGNLFSAMFKKLTADSRTTKGNRDKLKTLAENFETLASGQYPYKMKNVVLDTDPKFKIPKTQRTALDLLEFEEKMKLDYEDDEMRGMNKRQRRKFLMKQRKLLEDGLLDDNDDGDDDVADEEKIVEKSRPAKKAKKKIEKADSGVWTVENVKEAENIRPDSKDLSSLKTSTPSQSNKKNKISSDTSSKENIASNSNSSPLSKNKKCDSLNGSNISLKNNIAKTKKDVSVSQSKRTKKDLSESLNMSIQSSSTPLSKLKKKESRNSFNESPKDDKTPQMKTKSKQLSSGLSESLRRISTPQSKTKKKETLNGLNESLKGDFISQAKSKRKEVNESLKSESTSKTKTKKRESLNTSSLQLQNKKRDSSNNLNILLNSDSTPLSKLKKSILLNSSNLSSKSNLSPLTKSKKNESSSPNKNKKNESLNVSNLSNKNNSTPLSKNQKNISLNLSSSQKKVMISLKKNTAQGVMDYFKSVKQSPEIPFDGERKPLKTSLKPNAMPSPINPFYKKKLRLNF